MADMTDAHDLAPHERWTYKQIDALERISNDIRHGVPVGMLEAILAIDYQRAKQAYEKRQKWWRRLRRWAVRNFCGTTNSLGP